MNLYQIHQTSRKGETFMQIICENDCEQVNNCENKMVWITSHKRSSYQILGKPIHRLKVTSLESEQNLNYMTEAARTSMTQDGNTRKIKHAKQW